MLCGKRLVESSCLNTFSRLFVLFLSLSVILAYISATKVKAAEAVSIHIVTDGFAPLQYLVDGKPAGYVTEYVQKVLYEVNKRYPVKVASYEFLPWKRALVVAKEQTNTLFFSLSRTPARETEYQWIGTVSPYRQSFFRLKSNAMVTATNLAELRDSKAIVGIQRGGSANDLIDQLGFTPERDYTTYTHYTQGIKMLYNGRIDALPLTEFLARNSACRLGFDGDRLVPVAALEQLAKPLWATLSNSSDPLLIEVMQAVMTEMKEDGTHQEIVDRHLKTWENQPCVMEQAKTK